MRAPNRLIDTRGPLLDAHASAPWLVRAALSGGDAELAESIARVAETLAIANPGYPSLAAVAPTAWPGHRRSGAAVRGRHPAS
jgi:hypothetical protein